MDQLSLEISAGEVFGLLGPNGAGKTTTIRMMVGLIKASSGRVMINGLDVFTQFADAMAHVGAIVENPEMYGYLTGLQNLRHFARMCRGVSEADVSAVVKQVGLESRIHDRVKTYSLGMRQRLGLAQAMLRHPDVLILDEPTNGLDPAGIRELRDYLRRLSDEEGISVVVSSHLLSEMELMCDRVAIIQAGKLVNIQAMHEIQAMPGNGAEVRFDVADVHAAEVEVKALWPETSPTIDGTAIILRLNHDQIPATVAGLVGQGIQIYEVRVLRQSLEDQFLEMTGGRSID